NPGVLDGPVDVVGGESSQVGLAVVRQILPPQRYRIGSDRRRPPGKVMISGPRCASISKVVSRKRVAVVIQCSFGGAITEYMNSGYFQSSPDPLELLSAALDQYFGEPVTQLEHALQCAHLARQANADDDLVLAALLHDIGHLIAKGDEYGVADHNE